MQTEIDKLMEQIDAIEKELSSYAEVRSKINSLNGQLTSTKNKIKNLKSATMENDQKERIVTPGGYEFTVSKEIKRKVTRADIERMKKDGVYEKYTSLKPSIKMKSGSEDDDDEKP